jgi:carbonic anhydrase
MTPFVCPPRLALLLAAASLCCAGVAWAADGHAPAKAAAEDGKAAKPAAVKAERAAPAPADPMDMLRERLAQRLGAAKPPEAAQGNVVRVVSKASAAEAHGDAGPARASKVAAHGSGTGGLVAKLRAEKAAAGHKPGAHLVHWGYAGTGGPTEWGTLKPEFAKCASGTRQSPIDIRGGVKVDLEPIQFDYRPTGFAVVDNGHTVQVNFAPGNSIEVMGRRYDLLQFHFHRPSEERIDGRQFDMSAHLVHRDPEGRLAVVGVLLDRGSAHPAVQTVWNNLPLEKGEEFAAQVLLDPSHLLPADRRYFTYMGSLTTPPCSEGVLWMVMQQAVPVSPEQVAVFSRMYPMNARPIQSVAGRMIKGSN